MRRLSGAASRQPSTLGREGTHFSRRTLQGEGEYLNIMARWGGTDLALQLMPNVVRNGHEC